MTYMLRFLPAVEGDVLAAQAWYAEKAPGLGEDFLRVFYANASEIPRNPLRYPRMYDAFRRRLLQRFPYAIYFRIEDDVVIVFGLFHCARDPRTIRAQLRERNVPDSSEQSG